MKILFILLPVIFLLGCSNTSSLLDPDSSFFRGFHSSCKASLKVEGSPGSFSINRELPAGEQSLKVKYRSSYTFDYERPSPVGYLCAYESMHSVSFVSKPGKDYRFYVAEDNPGSYQITVLEIINKGSPKSVQIPVNSIQKSVKQQCRFFGVESDCR